MRLNSSLQFTLGNLARWLAIFAVVWLLGAVGLGWLVNSFLILFGLLLLAPVVAFFCFRWWLQRNLVQDKCPVCRYEFTGLNKTELQCPNCGEPLKIEQGHFQRLTPPGTIEVQAVEVEGQRIEE